MQPECERSQQSHRHSVSRGFLAYDEDLPIHREKHEHAYSEEGNEGNQLGAEDKALVDIQVVGVAKRVREVPEVYSEGECCQEPGPDVLRTSYYLCDSDKSRNESDEGKLKGCDAERQHMRTIRVPLLGLALLGMLNLTLASVSDAAFAFLNRSRECSG